MVLTLTSCKSKLLLKGIDVTTNAWQTSLTNSLQGYLSSFNGWNYSYDTDMLYIDVPQTVNVPANITDFGNAGGVQV